MGDSLGGVSGGVTVLASSVREPEDTSPPTRKSALRSSRGGGKKQVHFDPTAVDEARRARLGPFTLGVVRESGSPKERNPLYPSVSVPAKDGPPVLIGMVTFRVDEPPQDVVKKGTPELWAGPPMERGCESASSRAKRRKKGVARFGHETTVAVVEGCKTACNKQLNWLRARVGDERVGLDGYQWSAANDHLGNIPGRVMALAQGKAVSKDFQADLQGLINIFAQCEGAGDQRTARGDVFAREAFKRVTRLRDDVVALINAAGQDMASFELDDTLVKKAEASASR